MGFAYIILHKVAKDCEGRLSYLVG